MRVLFLTVVLLFIFEAPKFDSDPVTSVNDNEDEYRYGIFTSDADNDNVTVTATQLPDWLSLTSNFPYVNTFAGSGQRGITNGNLLEASFDGPFDIDADQQGNLYIPDISTRVIRKISPDGMVSIAAGTQFIGRQDGPAD